MEPISRRRFLIRSGGLLALAAGCRPERGEEQASPSAGPDRSGSAGCGTRVLRHKHGSTEITGVPERIVPLTVRDQDTLLALAATPIALQEGTYYRRPYPTWPWVRERLGDADPRLLSSDAVDYEGIAALRPDLVVGAGSGITERDYGILSRIAPTLAQAEGYVDHGVPWQEIARALGRALCREERAAERIADVEEALARVRSDRPELAGATGVVALRGGPDGSFWVYGPQDSRGRFLRSLGMTLPPELDELTRDRFAARVSAERMDLLNADLLIWLAGPEQRAALEENPVYRSLEVVRAGRVLYLPVDGTETAALTNTSVLNLPYLLDELVPRIAGALGAGAVDTGDG